VSLGSLPVGLSEGSLEVLELSEISSGLVSSDWVWNLSSFSPSVLNPVPLSFLPVVPSEGLDEIWVVLEVSHRHRSGETPLSSDPLGVPLLLVVVSAVVPGQDTVFSGVPSVWGEAPS